MNNQPIFSISQLILQRISHVFWWTWLTEKCVNTVHIEQVQELCYYTQAKCSRKSQHSTMCMCNQQLPVNYSHLRAHRPHSIYRLKRVIPGSYNTDSCWVIMPHDQAATFNQLVYISLTALWAKYDIIFSFNFCLPHPFSYERMQ